MWTGQSFFFFFFLCHSNVIQNGHISEEKSFPLKCLVILYAKKATVQKYNIMRISEWPVRQTVFSYRTD